MIRICNAAIHKLALSAAFKANIMFSVIKSKSLYFIPRGYCMWTHHQMPSSSTERIYPPVQHLGVLFHRNTTAVSSNSLQRNFFICYLRLSGRFPLMEEALRNCSISARSRWLPHTVRLANCATPPRWMNVEGGALCFSPMGTDVVGILASFRRRKTEKVTRNLSTPIHKSNIWGTEPAHKL